MKRILFSLIIGLCVFCQPLIALADDISFEASVNSNKISLKEALQLVLTVGNAKNDVDPVSLPNIDGFEARYVGPSTSYSWINGVSHSERSFTYNLYPSKTGHFKIPSITATINGKDYATNPIEVEVVNGEAANAGGSSESDERRQAEENLKDKIFMRMSLPTQEPFLNQQLPLRIKLYVRDIPMRDIQMPKLEQDSFIMDAFSAPVQSTETLNGLQYDTVEFKAYIYPTRIGEVIIAPAKVEGNLIYKGGSGRRAGAFGDDFFNSFFDNLTARPVSVTSNNLRLNVQSLPEGKPVDFSGAVGQFDFTATVSPVEVKAGDPITLRMSITGQGNLKNVRMPAFVDADFKDYDPLVKDIDGGKAIEQVIIPTDETVTAVGPLQFSYFDDLSKEYKTITQGPFEIKVTKPAEGQEFKAVGFAQLNDKPTLAQSTQEQQVNFWKELLVKTKQAGLKLLHQLMFWVLLISTVVIITGWRIWQAYRNRLATDTAFARRTKAFKGAREGIAQAKDALAKQDAKGFYAAVQKTINNYFADKMHRGLGAVSTTDIEVFLKTKNINGEILSSLTTILSCCEAVRFGGGNADPSRMQADFDKLQTLLASIEKKIK